jgi:Spy/CpxP family protein refolding chaperone
MKHTLSLAALVLAVSTLSIGATTAFAQQASDMTTATHAGKHDPHKTAMKMSRKLGLSQEQTAKLEPILAERRSKMEALTADTSLTEAQRKQQRRTIAQSTRQQMSAVLSPEQMKQLKEMHREKAHAAASPTGA